MITPGIGIAAPLFGAAAAALSVVVLGAAPALADSCPNAQLRTGYSASLPDCRAYEQVTPADKNNYEIDIFPGAFTPDLAATDGNRFGYLSFETQPSADSPGLNYLSTRGPGGWSQQPLIPPQSAENSILCPLLTGIVLNSSDLSKGLLADGYGQSSSLGCGTDDPPLVPGEPQGVQNLFVRDNTAGTYQLVSPNPVSGPPANAALDGGSADLSHVVFDEVAPLIAGAPSGDNLYDWSGGRVELVAIVNGSPVAGATLAGAQANFTNPVSADGSRILFNANGNLYDRVNAASTVQIDAPATGAAGPGGGGQFEWASTDGSKVFFTDGDSAGLTSDTVPGSGQNLYEYNFDAPAGDQLTDLTPVSGAQVQGVSGVSDDGSYVYFVADGALTRGATVGQPNLYVIRNGDPTTTRFIATLSSADSCDWSISSQCLSSHVSSNGAFLGFNSVNSLTGYNNAGHIEIYLYDAAANTLSCASCNPSGAPATVDTALPGMEPLGLDTDGYTWYLQRNVSDSGQVFFNTSEALLPAATNGNQDVYEYEGGHLYLISTGTSSTTDLFLDATPSGSDVFFATSQPLVPQDQDGAIDVYDARVDGGFAAPPVTSPPCSGDACRLPSTGSPPVPTPASVTFFGPGNVTGSPPAVVAIASKKLLKGQRFSVLVVAPSAGTITVHGASLVTVTKSVSRAGRYRLIVQLTRKARSAFAKRHRRKLRVTVHVTYTSAAGGSSTASFPITISA